MSRAPEILPKHSPVTNIHFLQNKELLTASKVSEASSYLGSLHLAPDTINPFP